MSNNERADAADDKSAWTRPGFIAAAAVIAIIVVLGLAAALSGGSKDDSENPARPPAGQPSAKANADESVCGLDPGSQAVPDSPPPAKWKLRGTVAVPSAPTTFGPGSVAGPASHIRRPVPSSRW